jgi:hypothetical protein
MLNRFKRSLRRWLDDSKELHQLVTADSSGHNRSLNSRHMSFNLYRAQGGWIVETRNYSNNGTNKGLGSSEPEYRLNIIQESQDLGQELSKIVFMENLRS